MEIGPKMGVQTSLSPFRIDSIVDVEVLAKPAIQKAEVEMRWGGWGQEGWRRS